MMCAFYEIDDMKYINSSHKYHKATEYLIYAKPLVNLSRTPRLRRTSVWEPLLQWNLPQRVRLQLVFKI